MTTYQALLVTGETYPNRRALRALGAVWQPDHKGYALPMEKREAAAALQGLEITPYDFDDDPFKPLSPDELRAYRQDRQDRRAERLLERAALADKRSDAAANKLSRGERDFLSLAEPVKVGHHSERRHRKLLDKALNSAMEAGREAKYAADLRSRAQWLQPARVKGDAAREHAEANAAKRDTFSVGDRVKSVIYGECIIIRRNPKSFSIRTSSGYVVTEAPRWITLLEKGNGEAPKVERKFKAGDAVLYYPHGKNTPGYTKAWPAKVLRATPNGYSIEHFHGDSEGTRPTRRTIREESLELAPAAQPAT